MMTRARKPAPKSETSFEPKRSQFAPRPFAPQVEVREPPSAESLERAARFGHSFGDVDILPRPVVQPKLTLGPVGDRYEQEAEPMQGKFASELTGTSKEVEAPPNRTGMPDLLKSGIENLSGMDLSGVRVHHNSAKPAQLNALAYTQGQEIHLAPGQDKHLPHEAWHAVQQAQGRVKPTMQAKGVSINDDATLEREADVMGVNANGLEQMQDIGNWSTPKEHGPSPLQRVSSSHAPVQRTVLSKVYGLKGGGTKRVFYSTYDPGTEFDDHMEAWKHDTKLAKANKSEFDPYARYPTNFSYYNTPPMNVMGSSKQGPHSLSHSSLSYRLNRRMKDKRSRTLREQQIPTPRKFRQLVENEMPKTMKPAQLERMLVDYQLLYDRLELLLDMDEENNGTEVHELIMRLIQMNPYSAYGKGRKTGRRNIKGHGERKEDRFDEAFDSGAKFRNPKNYREFKRMRQRLYSDEEVSSSEDKGVARKKRKKSSDEDAQVLTPIQVMVLLGRSAPGALYIMNDDDWDAYEQYKQDHPENRYKR